ncbi:MAG TPA: class I SAM-dependent methyltransferase [Stellaceae bacterium]|nr:class I SAM-dependent methyltransferase [Stellaceae bacterium]
MDASPGTLPFVEPFVARLLARFVDAGSVMLDVGCGPAGYRAAVKGRYVGVDITDVPYTPTAGRRLDAAAASDRLPFRAQSFDLVMCKSAFFLMPDHRATLAEFHRVLKQGGRLLLLDYNRRTQRRLSAREGVPYPCWTQWQLRRLAQECGFRQCGLLPTSERHEGAMWRLLTPVLQEVFGTWAIVTGVK